MLSIYLIKACLFRLNRLLSQLHEKSNLFGASPEVWQNTITSPWYGNFLKYCQYMLGCCETLYKGELAVFKNAISKCPQEQSELMLYNLGTSP